MGFLVAVLLFGGIAAATGTTRDITVIFRDIRLVINGQQVTPRDAHGNVVEPFILDGTTFLPVRAVAEAVGLPVHWDGNTNTVYLGQILRGVVGFDDLNPIRTTASTWGGRTVSLHFGIPANFTVRGEDLPISANALRATDPRSFSSNRYVTAHYAINGEFSRFTGNFAVTDGSGVAVTVSFNGDGRLLGSFTVSPGNNPVDIDIPLEGVETLQITFTGSGTAGLNAHAALYNARFYPAN